MKKVIFGFVCIIIAACAVQKSNTPLTPINVAGEWTLQTLNGNTIADLKRPLTINFNEAEKSVNGYAGCNQYFSTYVINGSSIRFVAPGRTKMYCQEAMDLEEKFILALADTESFTSEDNKLILKKGETVLLEFSK